MPDTDTQDTVGTGDTEVLEYVKAIATYQLVTIAILGGIMLLVVQGNAQ